MVLTGVIGVQLLVLQVDLDRLGVWVLMANHSRLLNILKSLLMQQFHILNQITQMLQMKIIIHFQFSSTFVILNQQLPVLLEICLAMLLFIKVNSKIGD
ncbi:MAG: hypothetical protein DRI57_00195 [Deltaproteobacteria bacterium]|nr:MAG: hypothetical protein DRI57_00195 [Deltaproteobacteria bacterium]